MFYSCNKLTVLDVSNFNTVNVTNMYRMFHNCSSLISLDVSNFNTKSVTSMDQMFKDCRKLTSLNLKNLDISKVTSYGNIFSYVPNDVAIYVSTDEMKAWVLDKNSSFTNIQVVT